MKSRKKADGQGSFLPHDIPASQGTGWVCSFPRPFLTLVLNCRALGDMWVPWLQVEFEARAMRTLCSH